MEIDKPQVKTLILKDAFDVFTFQIFSTEETSAKIRLVSERMVAYSAEITLESLC
jgi:hypothetical protein